MGLFCLTANSLLIDGQEPCLSHAFPGVVIPLSVRWIPSVSVSDLDLVQLEDGGIVFCVAGREQYPHYATCLALQQTARLPDYKPCDDDCLLQDTQATICMGAIYQPA